MNARAAHDWAAAALVSKNRPRDSHFKSSSSRNGLLYSNGLFLGDFPLDFAQHSPNTPSLSFLSLEADPKDFLMQPISNQNKAQSEIPKVGALGPLLPTVSAGFSSLTAGFLNILSQDSESEYRFPFPHGECCSLTDNK